MATSGLHVSLAGRRVAQSLARRPLVACDIIPLSLGRPSLQARRSDAFYPPSRAYTTATGSETGVTSKKKSKSKGRVSEESLAPLDFICLPNTDSLPASPPKETKDERHAMAISDKFFRCGYEFLYSADRLPSHPANNIVPEVVVLGASNAGKSSFLNGLVGRSDAARVSSRPGHTITMNAFGVGRLPDMSMTTSALAKGAAPPKHGLVMVDTPGYGFHSRAGWGDSICRYIERRAMLRGAVVLIPAQKNLTAMDKWVLRMLAERNKRTLVILTKADMAGRDWWAGCDALAREIRAEMRKLEKQLDNGWREGDGWVPEIYATAAAWSRRRGVGSAPGMGGARKAILEQLAGFTLDQKLETRPEEISYGGETVAWGDILPESDV